ncbi:hypothetical protein HK098_001336 [Nowakowskiella sp. JEL0407]|nr:hypothetical protein HK098_001336 [Nowakowskiella sp. JEL0407]
MPRLPGKSDAIKEKRSTSQHSSHSQPEFSHKYPNLYDQPSYSPLPTTSFPIKSNTSQRYRSSPNGSISSDRLIYSSMVPSDRIVSVSPTHSQTSEKNFGSKGIPNYTAPGMPAPLRVSTKYSNSKVHDDRSTSPISNASSHHKSSVNGSRYANDSGYGSGDMYDYNHKILVKAKTVVAPTHSMSVNDDVYSFSKKTNLQKDIKQSSPQTTVANPIIFAKPTLKSKKSSHSLKDDKPPASQITATLTEIDNICSLCLGALKQDENPVETQANDRALRKIMDLEISNTSLLAVNNSLESTIRKQAQTIERLKSQVIHLSGGSISKDDEFPDEQFEDVSSVPEDELESPVGSVAESTLDAPVVSTDELPPDEVSEQIKNVDVVATDPLTSNEVDETSERKPDEYEIILDRVCEKLMILIEESENALSKGNFIYTNSQVQHEGSIDLAENQSAKDILQSYDAEVVNALSSKLSTVISLRNQAADHNKIIAGVTSQTPPNKTVDSRISDILSHDARTIKLPMPVYSQICTLLEDLHVDFLCAPNNVDVTPHFQNPTQLLANDTSKADEKIGVETKQTKLTDKTPYRHLDESYSQQEPNRKGIPSNVGKGRTRRTTSSPQPFDEKKAGMVGTRNSRSRPGSAGGVNYANPKG